LPTAFFSKKKLLFHSFFFASLRVAVALRLHGILFFHYSVDCLSEFTRALAHAEKNPPLHPFNFSAIATASARIRAHGI
jgi:hypothetical protein